MHQPCSLHRDRRSHVWSIRERIDSGDSLSKSAERCTWQAPPMWRPAVLCNLQQFVLGAELRGIVRGSISLVYWPRTPRAELASNREWPVHDAVLGRDEVADLPVYVIGPAVGRFIRSASVRSTEVTEANEFGHVETDLEASIGVMEAELSICRWRV